MPRWITATSPVSRRSTRYLPRRSAPVILAPSSRLTNCFFGCRRTVRVPVTCTVFTRLPTTSRSSPRRIVSTSGSSGIPARLDRHRAVGDGLRLAHGVELLSQSLPGRSRRGGLGLLLRAALTLPPDLASNPYHGEEALCVIRALVADRVAGQLGEVAGRELLQAGLVVLPARSLARLPDAVAEQVDHHPLGRLPSRGEVHHTEDRFEGVGEDRRLLPAARARFALAEQQRRAQFEHARDLRARRRAHYRGPHLGQPALGQVRVGPVDVVGDDEAEHRVAEEFAAFVRLVARVLRAPCPVRERKRET